MFCTQCGNKIKDGSRFCSKCGVRLNFVWDEAQPEPSAQQMSETELSPGAQLEAAPIFQAQQSPASETGSAVQPLPQTQSFSEEQPSPSVEPEQQAIAGEGGFLDHAEYVIDEKVQAFKFASAFAIYDTAGNIIGALEQENISGGAAAARILLGSKAKGMQKFKFKIHDASGSVIAQAERGAGGSGMNVVVIMDGSGRTIGTLVGGNKIKDASGKQVAKIKLDYLLGVKFPVLDMNGNQIGLVNRKWNGAKSIFTSADKWMVSLEGITDKNLKLIALAAAGAFDMLTR